MKDDCNSVNDMRIKDTRLDLPLMYSAAAIGYSFKAVYSAH